MIFRKIVCILALATGSSAFAPAPTSRPAAAIVSGRNNDLGVMRAVAEATSASVLQDYEHHTSTRLPYSPTGYSTWEWKTHHNEQNQLGETKNSQTSHSINYLEIGDSSKPALLLVHGFGASSYHFRYNIPILARKYHVYAIDMLGFGWSDKPIMDYDASVWRDQVVDFVQEVILDGDENNEKSIAIAGNSLGGYTAMYAASDERIKDNVKACILLNSADDSVIQKLSKRRESLIP